ncbi:methyltransferase domain-containing protein [Ophiostoma piceae UAMH 11346]|uniref:Methyltransferase domain-containing protein n=1 Tax=Ophiostoma piceae (strain UAMH 11346) TaxID=1262450 RepID=S3BZF5_OPHP1|nr:methyltransferase domain-containing protein [Ophiostoma piceae UAMH 11346]
MQTHLGLNALVYGVLSLHCVYVNAPTRLDRGRRADSASGSSIGEFEPIPLDLEAMDVAAPCTSSSVDSSYGSDSCPDGSSSIADSLHPSIGSAIYKHSYERGRRYHYFRNGKYPIPNDDREQDREDMKHALVLELTDGQLIAAPITDPQRIIDLGTGTGIWAMEVGDKYPMAQVVGVDLSPIQPVWVPPNVSFIIDDIEDEWITSTGVYDYVHLRTVLQFVDPVKVLGRCFANMRPGGWIETGDFDGDIHCDDGTMPPGWPVKVFWDKLAEAMPLSTDAFTDDTKERRDMQVVRRTGVLLAQAGFVNVAHKSYKVPIGIWPANKTMRLIGMYMRQVMRDFFEAAALKPYQTLGMSDDEISAFLATVQTAIQSCHPRGVHAYTKYYIWTAQKPAQ